MTTITVANGSDLNAAISSAHGGDTIVLKNGYYGSVKVTADFASDVTIHAENRLGATISNLQLSGASNLIFDGIKFNSGSNGSNGRGIVSMEYGTHDITIGNSELTGSVDGKYAGHYGVYLRGANNVTLKNNHIHDVDSGIVAFGSSGSEISGNEIDWFGRDAMKFSGIRDTEITGNSSHGHIFAIGSVHTDFIQFQGNSSDVLIEGNLFLPANRAAVQGVFMGDGTYNDITVVNNLIVTGMLRGISISKGSGNVVKDNTLIDVPDMIHKGTAIMVPGGTVVDNNFVASYDGGTYGSNVKLQNTKPGADFYIDDYFKHGSAGLGITIQDLTPVNGSLAETKGADALLHDLLGGGSWTPTAPSAPSTPATPSAPSAPAPSAPSAGDATSIAVNAGGGASNGFAADAFYFGGSEYGTKAGIANTSADALYKTERYGDFHYGADVENGTYAVTLKMAEIYWNAAGKRVFDVKAEGKVMLDNYDIFHEAGGKNIAHDETFAVKVTDGHLDLDFVSLVDCAKVGAIDIDLI